MKIENKEGKLRLGFKLIWSSPAMVPTVVSTLVNGYLSFYATKFMMIPIGTVGLLLMLSKVFDGFTDLMAGYLIDRTHTKLGKARPYQIATLFFGLTAILLFCAPEMGVKASEVYLFIMYSLVYSVCYTFIAGSEPVYLSRVIRNPEHVASLASFSGTISIFASIVVAAIVPQMVAAYGETRSGWRWMAAIMIIPFTIVGMLRFLLVKEKYGDSSNVVKEKRSVGQQIKLISGNKYLLIFSVFTLVGMITANLGQSIGTYYLLYMFGDIGLGSWNSLSAVLMVVCIIIMPLLARKFSFMKVYKTLIIISGFGFCIKLINLHSVPLMVISNILSTVVTVSFMFVNVQLMECMDYGEWKDNVRAEGAVTSIFSFSSKIGTAVGLGAAGTLMQMAGFDAALSVQSSSAMWMLIGLTSFIPAILCVIMLVVIHFYDLDKKIDNIRIDLKEKQTKIE